MLGHVLLYGEQLAAARRRSDFLDLLDALGFSYVFQGPDAVWVPAWAAAVVYAPAVLAWLATAEAKDERDAVSAAAMRDLKVASQFAIALHRSRRAQTVEEI